MNTNFPINVKEFAEKNFVSLEEAHSHIQLELFNLGYHWESTSSKMKPQHTFGEVLYINKDMTLQFGSLDYYEKEEANNYPLGSITTKRQMAVEVIIPKAHVHLLEGLYTKEKLLEIIKELGDV